jgi:hypothetical protein
MGREQSEFWSTEIQLLDDPGGPAVRKRRDDAADGRRLIGLYAMWGGGFSAAPHLTGHG